MHKEKIISFFFSCMKSVKQFCRLKFLSLFLYFTRKNQILINFCRFQTLHFFLKNYLKKLVKNDLDHLFFILDIFLFHFLSKENLPSVKKTTPVFKKILFLLSKYFIDTTAF